MGGRPPIGDMRIAENNSNGLIQQSHIAVEPMFGNGVGGNDYYSDAPGQPADFGVGGGTLGRHHHSISHHPPPEQQQHHSHHHPPANLNISANLPIVDDANSGGLLGGEDYRGKTSTSS